jgi:hypothetical protein
MNSAGAAAAVIFAAHPATQPPAGFVTQPNCQALAQQLLQFDILRFVTYGDRSPYLGNFLVGGKQLMVSLLHAPGPNEFPGTAINIIGLLAPIQAQVANDNNLLIMGDFNIPQSGMTRVQPVWGRYAGSNGTYTFGQVTPKQVTSR